MPENYAKFAQTTKWLWVIAIFLVIFVGVWRWCDNDKEKPKVESEQTAFATSIAPPPICNVCHLCSRLWRASLNQGPCDGDPLWYETGSCGLLFLHPPPLPPRPKDIFLFIIASNKTSQEIGYAVWAIEICRNSYGFDSCQTIFISIWLSKRSPL